MISMWTGYREVFDTMDTNNDQGLCVKELEFALQAVGYNPTGEEMEGFMTQFDNDGMFLQVVVLKVEYDNTCI